MQTRTQLTGWVIAGAIVAGGAWWATAGPLDPPPGQVQPTGHTLDQIYEQVSAGGGTCGSAIPGDPRFLGDVQIAGIPGPAEGAIIMIGYTESAQTPFDPDSGQQLGQPQFGPIVITKDLDRTTPLLYQALDQSMPLQEATLRFFDGSGHYFTIELDDLRIVSISSRMQLRCDGSYAHIEDVALLANDITWRHEPDGIEYRARIFGPPG